MEANLNQPLKMNPEVQRIFKRVLNLISSEIRFEESKKLLLKFYPVSDPSEIKERQIYLKKMLELAREVERVSKIERPKFKLSRMVDRVLIVGEKDYERAVKLELCDVNVDGNYDIVLGSVISIDEISPEEVAPEIFIKELYDKRDSIREVSKVMQRLGMKSVADEILNEVEEVEGYFKRLELIDYFEEFVYEKLEEIKKAIEKRVEKERIVFEGREILDIFERREILSEKMQEIQELIEDEIERAEKELTEKFGFQLEIFERYGLPRVKLEEMERVRREIERNAKLDLYLKTRQIMRKIKPMLQELEREYDLIFEIEMVKGLESFFGQFCFPEFDEGAIYFRDAVNLFIKDPQPISYLIGEGRINGFKSNERVVLLTGANSGGKTSLLNLIVQIQLLAQMGLPVPAKEVKTEVVDEIHFFARKKAVYGAGAFESMLNNLTSSLTGKGRKLILVDEFEAVTEPGAAMKMLASFLRIALERGFYMVVVSHLAENLELDFVRVDGIEASGLDERLELIVDRQPKFGTIGKSTPELIVERAYRLSKGEKREIFKILLNTFRKG
jgi:hypothetical protein